jgi:uncharacterized protein (DUF1330 family)
MSAYVIANITVTDPAWIEDYIPKVQALVAAAGGRYLSNTSEPVHLEGPGSLPSAAAILEFPNKESARAWYDSDDYAPFRKARQDGSTGDFFLLDGL